MDITIFRDFTNNYQNKLQNLAKQKKFLIGNTITDEKAVSALLSNSWLEKYPTAVCIDLPKAVGLYLSSNSSEEEKINTAFTMARVNFMGTDGVRGKVVTQTKENFIADLLKDNAFTPDLVEITSFSFAKILLDKNIVKTGDTAVIGNDGRDLAYNWVLNNSVRSGFAKAGLDVLDLGIVPTAVIPWKNLLLGYRAGACLTASHNPSNQNGIKFFIDGKKLVPETDLGDYALSAYMYNYCCLEKLPQEATGKTSEYNAEEDAIKWMMEVLDNVTSGNAKSTFKDITLIFDSANGATDTIGRKVLENLGAKYISVNEKCTGDNINRGVGVAEIEGTEFYSGKMYNKHIPTVKKIFDEGRKLSKENTSDGGVYGIAVDGDGDRGFLLYYSKKEDSVHVLDGDKCGYILAQYLIKSKGLNPKNFWFLSTIESDIMTSSAAHKNLGLNTKIVSVGDKWIGNFKEGEILVGLEISGHLIFPIEVTDKSGKKQTLLSGVGLLTGLASICAIKGLALDEEKIIRPFEPGFSKTFYVFFVDKTRHYRGSAIWNKDKELVEKEIKDAAASGKLPKNTRIKYEDKEDPNVLYMNIQDGETLLGVLFMRNSGTEDKNAVYVKGEREYEEILCEIGGKVQIMHTAEMKNENRIEYKYEQAIMKNLDDNCGETTIDNVLSGLGADVNESDLFAVIHGLKKEGRISVLDREITKV
uniref:Phosphoglucosamine mutase n=1 Tax=uncultured bacterium contig00064 TaxID=1181547 RepID=A0A806KDM6_9BACT|nr:phosphoglucosamine mutase [uncultured bacterium contig00064]